MRAWLSAWLAVAFLPVSAWAQSADLPSLTERTFGVADRVSVTLPAHWRVERSDNDDDADGSSLTASSAPAPSKALVKVAVVRAKASQSDLNRMVRINKAKLLDSVRAQFESDLPRLTEQMQKQGRPYLGHESFSVAEIDGLTAFVISYQRAGPDGRTPFLVSIYQVPMGDRKVVLNLSYSASDAPAYRPMIEAIRASTVIKR
ncbi:hypothetical protein BH10PSE17_BH10PSE17_26130 [soil metagenome]